MLTMLRSNSTCPKTALQSKPGKPQLRLVQSLTLEEFFARDCRMMINCACGLLEKEYTHPADALIDVAAIMDFNVVRRFLVNRQSNFMLETRTIEVCSTLTEDEAVFAVAKEIGHIRLHYFDLIHVGPTQVVEAEIYAKVFLSLTA